MTYKDILRVIPTIQAASLVEHNVRFAKKKKKKSSDFLSTGVDNILGTSFIQTEAQFID